MDEGESLPSPKTPSPNRSKSVGVQEKTSNNEDLRRDVLEKNFCQQKKKQSGKSPATLRDLTSSRVANLMAGGCSRFASMNSSIPIQASTFGPSYARQRKNTKMFSPYTSKKPACFKNDEDEKK